MKWHLLPVTAITLIAALFESAEAREQAEYRARQDVTTCIASDVTNLVLIDTCRVALAQNDITDSERTELLLVLGHALYNEKLLEEAEETFAAMLRHAPADHRALNGLGLISDLREDFATARDHFQQALALLVSATALTGLGNSLWQLGEASETEALALLDEALEIDPKYDWALRQKAWLFLDIDRPALAVETFTTLINELPYDQNARAGLVSGYRALGDLENALLHANRGYAEKTEDYWFLTERSEIYFELGFFEQAVVDAEKLIEIEPDWSESYVLKARPLAKLDRLAEAVQLLTEAEEHTGPEPYLIYWHASLLLAGDRLDAALAQIERLTNSDAADFYDFELLSLIQIARKDYPAARVAVDRALHLGPDEPMAIYFDARLILYQDNTPQEAMDRFNVAVGAGLSKTNVEAFANELQEAGFPEVAEALRAKYSE